MFKTSYAYPGDPVAEVVLQFGGEFVAANPHREIVVSGGSLAPAHIPVEDTICDSCNASVEATDPCAITNARLYCWECYTRWIKPHLRAA